MWLGKLPIKAGEERTAVGRRAAHRASIVAECTWSQQAVARPRPSLDSSFGRLLAERCAACPQKRLVIRHLQGLGFLVVPCEAVANELQREYGSWSSTAPECNHSFGRGDSEGVQSEIFRPKNLRGVRLVAPEAPSIS